MAFHLPCAICSSPVRVPLSVYTDSAAAPALVRAARSIGRGPSGVGVVCQSCALEGSQLLGPDERASSYVLGTGLLGLLAAIMVAFLAVYPAAWPGECGSGVTCTGLRPVAAYWGFWPCSRP